MKNASKPIYMDVCDADLHKTKDVWVEYSKLHSINSTTHSYSSFSQLTRSLTMLSMLALKRFKVAKTLLLAC